MEASAVDDDSWRVGLGPREPGFDSTERRAERITQPPAATRRREPIPAPEVLVVNAESKSAAVVGRVVVSAAAL